MLSEDHWSQLKHPNYGFCLCLSSVCCVSGRGNDITMQMYQFQVLGCFYEYLRLVLGPQLVFRKGWSWQRGACSSRCELCSIIYSVYLRCCMLPLRSFIMGQVANRAQNRLKSGTTENRQEAVNICTCKSLGKKKKVYVRMSEVWTIITRQTGTV